MPRSRTPLQRAAGKLISAIQKEWGAELGSDLANATEEVLSRSHAFIQAADANAIQALLGGQSVEQHLDDMWVRTHPSVKPFIRDLERVLAKEIGVPRAT